MVKRKVEKFPLTRHHATGQWSKCFTLPNRRRKTVYFGTDRDGTLTKYLTEREEWQAGRNPRATPATAAAATLSDLFNVFLARTKERSSSGEISPVTFGDKLWVGEKLVEYFGRD